MKGNEAEEVSRGPDIQIPEANELSQLKSCFPFSDSYNKRLSVVES